MTAMTYESAKNIGIAVAVGLLALMVISVIVIKNVTAKLITVAHHRRTGVRSVDSAIVAAGLRRQGQGRGVLGNHDVTCSFLGSDVNISAP